MPSDGKGLQNRLNLTFTELNKIAEKAGIATKSVGSLKWTVWSSKGLNTEKSLVSGIFEVERPSGFPTPDELFILGTATEAGDNVSNSLPLKRTGNSTYEIYTSLKAGDYHFISRKSGTPEVFSIEGSDLVADGKTEYTGSEKVYRIRIDFSDGSVKMAEVEKIEIWFPPTGSYLFSFDYVSNGTWRAENKAIEFKQESWGRDERYKFKFTIKDAAGNSTEEWFGSTNADNQKPDNNTPESYWFMVPVTDDYWANTFKFAANVDMKNVDIDIIFNSSVSSYTHKITVL